jgi:hypothetical protein
MSEVSLIKCSKCQCKMLLSFYSKNPKTNIYFKCCNQCRAKPRKKCIHNKEKSTCKECGGIGICIHNKEKKHCKECGGSQICEHNREKSQCKGCKGGNICIHNKRRSQCKECGGSSICIHNKHKATCKLCSTVLQCNKCKYETASKSHMKAHIKSCVGNEQGSSGEVKIKRVLDDMKINYEYDLSHEVKNEKNNLLRWDFIIKTNEEPLFIEYDGQQHFKPATFGGISKEQAEIKLKKTKEHDKLKNDYCNDNGYLLLRIPYTEYGIPQLITNFICENTNWGYE